MADATTTTKKVPSWDELREFIHATTEQIEKTGQQMKETDRKLDKLFNETSLLFNETSLQMKETGHRLDKLFNETGLQIKETDRKLDKLFNETGLQIKETDRKLDKLFNESAKRMERNDEEIKKHAERIDRAYELYGGFTNEFGKIIEDLCRPAALKIFKKEGIGIDHIYEGPRRGSKDEEESEVDVLLCNKTAAVAGEIKTTCFKQDIDHFHKQMKNFKKIFHEFEDKTVYVAIAAMRFANGSDTYARRKGMYVLTPANDGTFELGKPTVKRREL